MPTVARSRTVGTAPQRVWEVVADPGRLPEWWPNVERVEAVSRRAWTAVLATPKGRFVRADYTLIGTEHPARLSWRQELEDSPFGRFFSEAVTDVELEPSDAGTLVRLTATLGLRGLSRLGGLLVRRAARTQLDEALDGLQAVAGEAPAPAGEPAAGAEREPARGPR